MDQLSPGEERQCEGKEKMFKNQEAEELEGTDQRKDGEAAPQQTRIQAPVSRQ